MTAYNNQEDEVPIDSSLRNFGSSFGIPNPVGAAQVPCKRLAINGATKGRYFEFPPMQQGPNDVFYCDESFVQRVITKIEACVGVGIYSLRLQYHDGSQSPLFGHRAPNTESDIAIDQQTQEPAHIGAASIQAWGENYVQVLTLLGGPKNENIIMQLTSQKGKGEVKNFVLEEGERIVGVYGYVDNHGDVRGFGLVTVNVQ